MAPRQIKMREQMRMPEQDAGEAVPEQVSQRKQAETGRFLLQVDRQTKGSYATMEGARTAGLAIKKSHPVVQVSVYDTLETQNTAVELPAA
ncbi:MAG: hypothetical protein ACJ8F3_01950 [Xanthobacteraceae bacterium]